MASSKFWFYKGACHVLLIFDELMRISQTIQMANAFVSQSFFSGSRPSWRAVDTHNCTVLRQFLITIWTSTLYDESFEIIALNRESKMPG